VTPNAVTHVETQDVEILIVQPSHNKSSYVSLVIQHSFGMFWNNNDRIDRPKDDFYGLEPFKLSLAIVGYLRQRNRPALNNVNAEERSGTTNSCQIQCLVTTTLWKDKGLTSLG